MNDDSMNNDMPLKKNTNQGTDTLPFRQILKSVMADRGLSIRQVSDLANVKSTTVSNWLEGKNPHDLQAVDRLAKCLGLSFKGLLLGQDESIQGAKDISEVYDEKEFFDGLAKIKITHLIPRGNK